MHKIRSETFETNSSSVHTIVIQKQPAKNIYPINIMSGQYGWERDWLATPGERASYLYTAMTNLLDTQRADKFMRNILPEDIRYACKIKGSTDGYIDHAEDLKPWVNDLLQDHNKAIRFIFGDESYVYTTNDNVDEDEEDAKILADADDDDDYEIYVK